MKKIGIDALSFYVPSLYVDMKDLAQRRDIPFEKLNRGLGLNKMAVPDTNEDAASFAASALIKLFEDFDINPANIGRIYLGTESALDASKPTATYAVEALEHALIPKFGDRCLMNCDVLDMTFACVGAVDALHNSLDWIRNNPHRQAIVVASDLSKYDLNSTGEYTQGAGAVAMLVKADPRVLSIDDTWGVATKSEGDFFKPRRIFTKMDLACEIADLLNHSFSEEEIKALMMNSDSEFWSHPNETIEVFKEEPVFDGQFSNQCYLERITEALDHFNRQDPTDFLSDWQHIIFHLPYAFHGRRIVFDNWLNWLKSNGGYVKLIDEIGSPDPEDLKSWKRLATKSEFYKSFISEKIIPGEKASMDIGNMYTASIFMSFLSLLCDSLRTGHELSGQTVGFIGYGSGSKSKVFQGIIAPDWKEIAAKINLFEYLDQRQKIDVDTYEKLHNNTLQASVTNMKTVSLSHTESGETNKGLRRYQVN